MPRSRSVSPTGPGRYRFNSITCFLFIRRFRSHGTAASAAAVPPRRIGWSRFFFFFAVKPYTYSVPSDQVEPVAVKVLDFRSYTCASCTDLPFGAARSPGSDPRQSPLLRVERARGKGEIFESDDANLRAQLGLVIRPGASCLSSRELHREMRRKREMQSCINSESNIVFLFLYLVKVIIVCVNNTFPFYSHTR